MAKVSVIVPCYNQAKYLPECLDSLLAQSFPDWECIIINDGSEDDTDEVIDRYCKIDERFKYIRQNNQGVSAARNNGIKKSHGVYILPLDGDDAISPTYIERAVAIFESFPETKLVYCKADFFGDFEQEWLLPAYKYEFLLWSNCIFCSAMYKRADFDNTIGYNTNMKDGFEDWDFWLSLLDKDSIVYQIDEVLFHYRQKGYSRNKFAIEKSKLLNQQVYDNHSNLYVDKVKDIINIRNEVVELKRELNLCKNNLSSIQHSHSYRLGYFLLTPFRWIKKLIRRRQDKA